MVAGGSDGENADTNAEVKTKKEHMSERFVGLSFYSSFFCYLGGGGRGGGGRGGGRCYGGIRLFACLDNLRQYFIARKRAQ